MNALAANAVYDDLHTEKSGRVYHDGTFTSWAKERSPFHPFHYREGVSVWVAPVDLTPDDMFLSPPSTPKQRVSEPDEPDQAKD